MKNLILSLPSFGLLSLLVAFLPQQIRGQCNTPISHTSGTVSVGCTSVTVTSDGSVGSLGYCTEIPYWIGAFSISGSYTFTFSPPVFGVTLGLTAINNQPGSPLAEEEVRIEINGIPYPITMPGTPGECFTPAIITPTGAIGAVTGEVGAWDSLNINTTISTLKVEDVIFAGGPNGVIFSLFFCSLCCATNAGVISASPLHFCPSEAAMVPPATQTVLDGDDLLQYILFSNPADTLGSILTTSNTPSFAFNPATMQTGVTYYVAAIAGNNLNGNVDLNDPCLDISNAIQVTWRPLPTVTFSAANPEVCAGACTTMTANFTGTAPFTVTYTSPVTGSVTQTFSGNTGTFQVCTAAGGPPGSLMVQATALVDSWCVCE